VLSLWKDANRRENPERLETVWMKQNLLKIHALDALPGWSESSNPAGKTAEKAKSIRARIAAFASFVLRLVAWPAGARRTGKVLPLARS
jgi:hypothetical protein